MKLIKLLKYNSNSSHELLEKYKEVINLELIKLVILYLLHVN